MKNLSNLGKILSKTEQKAINGGIHKCGRMCTENEPCCRLCDGGYFCPHKIPPNGLIDGEPVEF